MIRIEPVSPVIGAEVHRLDLGQPLSDEDFQSLHDAWMEHLVLFFRDQPLDIERLQALGRRFGDLHVHPMGDVEGYPGMIAIHTDAESPTYAGRGWHSDVSCDEAPPAASILHLHEVPPVGGDTLFANMYAAYEALSPGLAGFVESLTAVHTGGPNYQGYFGHADGQFRDGKPPEAVHPVVRVHPVTGRKALFVNEIFTSHIVELAAAESRALLDFLYRHIASPRFQCRFTWRRNSAVLWDNRCAQHMAIMDYWPHTRSGHRVTIAGDRPV